MTLERDPYAETRERLGAQHWRDKKNLEETLWRLHFTKSFLALSVLTNLALLYLLSVK